MHEPKKYKSFIEINTFKVHVQAILNRLKKQNNLTDVVPAINLILDGGPFDFSSSSAEIIALNSLLHHPELYIKNIDPQVKENIYSEIKEILKNFIREVCDVNDDSICAMPAQRV
ncbi:Uncharacterised protein [Legionella steigerwaltii]|uniref:Uncharacterized protein n=1 Tax=Legionella steigerwaltii TaxID=460 RepID=A0A378L950_9GAMM|nr:hypothetical protein [Legionella steigerwaltii]KTD80296.1 hypothetical protein Lstg_0558 [Legionella steigerwaltii]STY22378.1 Uncharacterised protein [Legionella steigerwaltii]